MNTLSELNSHEIEVLEMLSGQRKPEWGAWVGACLEFLSDRGLCTSGPNYQITDEGKRALASLTTTKSLASIGVVRMTTIYMDQTGPLARVLPPPNSPTTSLPACPTDARDMQTETHPAVNVLARAMQRQGASGTEEELEAMIEPLVRIAIDDALERAAQRITRDTSWCLDASAATAGECASRIRSLKSI
jgi:hypothetical protein